MKKNDKIEQMTDSEWADAAAWLSGEETAGPDAARLLLDEENEIMRKWNDLKMTDIERKIDVDMAWSKLNRKIELEDNKQNPRVRLLIPAMLRVAAMIIVAIGLGWMILRVATPEKITVAAEMNEKKIEVIMPDGSKAFLNHDSQLTYPESFNRNNRKVSLTGEAFFEITPDATRPFIIDAGEARVRVLGTTFNVITDNGNNEVEVYVATGKVLLSNGDGSQNLTLEPGFIGKVSSDKGEQTLNTNINYMSWNSDVLEYDGERLAVVFKDLKHAYNIDIVAADPLINNFRLTTLFDNQPHDTIIKVICTTFNLKAVKEGGTYALSPR